MFVAVAVGWYSLLIMGTKGGGSWKQEFLSPGVFNVSCAKDQLESPVAGCSPSACARVVIEDFVTKEEAAQLRTFAESIMKLGGYGSGPPTVLDLTTGAVSHGDRFMDVYRHMEANKLSFSADDIALYRRITQRVLDRVRSEFGLSRLWLTSPNFFSRIQGDKKARTMNDEYWHNHIDKLQYGSFAYTGLIYLNDYETEYQGGTFTFVDEDIRRNHTLKPRTGMLNLFTSGAENVHRVDPVTSGVRYALTIAFTCDHSKAVTNFLERARVAPAA
jgi:hypothetical protein